MTASDNGQRLTTVNDWRQPRHLDCHEYVLANQCALSNRDDDKYTHCNCCSLLLLMIFNLHAPKIREHTKSISVVGRRERESEERSRGVTVCHPSACGGYYRTQFDRWPRPKTTYALACREGVYKSVLANARTDGWSASTTQTGTGSI